MEDIIKGVWPFMIAQLVVLLLMILFPALVTRADGMVQRLTCTRDRLHCIGINP
jgi:TRAP-type mannitol/chloroaromatic compound transport system permease large subunit